MTGYHLDACRFLLKLRHALLYLHMDPGFYDFVHSLQDNSFIPFNGADPDNFIDVVDDDREDFILDIINFVDDSEPSLE